MTETPTPDRAALLALRERVRALEGPDGKVDLRVFCALFPDSDPFNFNGDRRWSAYTSSLDAVVALIERVAPEWRGFAVGFDRKEGARAWMRRGITSADRLKADAPTPALALLLALLEALAGEEQGG